MGVFQTIINYVLNLGSTIFVPLIILILGLLAGMKLEKAFTSVLTLGIAFSGMSMVIGYISNVVSPASKALAKNTGTSLPALDLGWTGAASITWSWDYAFIFFTVMIGVNFISLLFSWTRTLDVDMWNAWGKALTVYLIYYVPGSLAAGLLTVMIRVILRLKLGDMFQKCIQDLTGIPLVIVTHFMASVAVSLLSLNMIVDKIPALNKRADTDALRKKIGIFSENSVMGLATGLGPSFVVVYGISSSLNLTIQTATALGLFPMISKMSVQSLFPLTDVISEFVKKRFKDREVYIGLGWPISAGHSEIWVTTILLVPVFIGYAIILLGSQVLPLAGTVNYSTAVGRLLLTGGNLVRMLIPGIITTSVYLCGAIYLAPILSDLAEENRAVGGIKRGQLVAWSFIEGLEFRVLFAEALNRNILVIVGCVIFLGLFVLLYKYAIEARVSSERYAELQKQHWNGGKAMKREETDKIKWTVTFCGTLLLFLYGLFTQNIIINLLVIFFALVICKYGNRVLLRGCDGKKKTENRRINESKRSYQRDVEKKKFYKEMMEGSLRQMDVCYLRENDGAWHVP